MDYLKELLLLPAGVFLVLLLLFNFIIQRPPQIPGDLYTDKLPIKLYIPVLSTIIVSIIAGIILHQLKP